MSNFITHNLARLATFTGRDTRAQFWPYAGVVFLAQQAIVTVGVSTIMTPMMTKMQSMAIQSPNPGDPAAMEAWNREFMAMFEPMFSSIMVVNYIATAVVVALYAAAVTRRLHDRGLSGWWGLLPLPFIAFGALLGPKIMESVTAPENFSPGLVLTLMLSNLTGFAALLTLIVMLAKRSEPEANRYGPPPAGA